MLDCNFGLSSAFLTSNAKTISLSAENPTGEKGKGGMAENHLGVGRKGRACVGIAANETITLADVEGPGIIQHIWITTNANVGPEDARFMLRNLILKMYWDNEETPSVECPLGDFFCNGFGQFFNVNALPISANPTGGLNCYFPLPFRKHARIEVVNTLDVAGGALFYQVTYSKVDELPDNAAYFHAQWRRTEHITRGQDHVLLDGVKGKGQYVGTYLAISALGRSWWGEGEMKFFIDGDTDFPSICGTGTEDYVGGAWCFEGGETKKPACYSTPFLGYYYLEDSNKIDPWFGHNVALHSMYRFHLPDPIRFESDLKVTIQDIGHNGVKLFERDDDIASVSYWYQCEPHNTFPVLPDVDGRRPR